MRDYESLSRAFFDKQAEKYDETNTVFYSKNGKISCKDIMFLLRGVPYERLLDVGCGTGFLIDLLAHQSSAEFEGIDLSSKMISKAKSKEIERANFQVGSAQALPYPDESFNIVTCVQSFHHYPQPEQAMSEAFRVLKKGGLYILGDTGMDGFLATLENRFILPFCRTGDCRTEGMYSIVHRMQKQGFDVLTFRRLKPFIYRVIGRKM